MSATALVKLLLIAATFASALIYLILGSRMGGVAAPLDQSGGGLAVRVIVQASKDSATVAADPGNSGSYSPTISGARFRLGYLEFEDGPDI
jgi:hypothetical protein